MNEHLVTLYQNKINLLRQSMGLPWGQGFFAYYNAKMYLGVSITNDLCWNTHVGNICTKANRTLGFLRPNISSCPRDVKEMAYKGLVRPILEYASPVWDPSGKNSSG